MSIQYYDPPPCPSSRLPFRNTGVPNPRSNRLCSSGECVLGNSCARAPTPTPTPPPIAPAALKSIAGPSGSSSLSCGVPSALRLTALTEPDAFRRALRAWNVRLAVAFENSGSKYRSSSAWNHFPSSLALLSSPWPVPLASCCCCCGPACPPPPPAGAAATVLAIGSTSTSESYDSDDAAENTLFGATGDTGDWVWWL